MCCNGSVAGTHLDATTPGVSKMATWEQPSVKAPSAVLTVVFVFVLTAATCMMLQGLCQ